MMTKQKAKDLTIEVWEVLADDGEIMEKYEIPVNLYNQIKDLYFECPLCELFNNPELGAKEHPMNCTGCPLKEAGQQCFSGGDFYSTWEEKDIYVYERAEAAQGIVDIVKRWEVNDV